jgi:MtN3 and saliva related transmembrane protein
MDSSILGGFAGLLTSIAVIPQLIKTWRTRHARDLSLWQLIIINAGLLLWLGYGLALNNLPLIASNAFTLSCYILLLTMKVCFDRGERNRKAV